MGFLSNQLTALLTKYRMSQRDLAVMIDAPDSHVSRICTGNQVFVTDSDLDKIIHAIMAATKLKGARAREDQGKLVKARLLDAYNGEFADTVRIVTAGGSVEKLRTTDLKPDVKKALDLLASEALERPEVGAVIVSLARVTGLRE